MGYPQFGIRRTPRKAIDALRPEQVSETERRWAEQYKLAAEPVRVPETETATKAEFTC